MSKVFIICPANLVTGGTESLHQLAHELRNIGVDAFISYWPAETKILSNRLIEDYGVPSGPIQDEPDNVIIIPEIYTKLVPTIKFANRTIWWLSVDNYFRFPQNYRYKSPHIIDKNKLYNVFRNLRSLAKKRKPLSKLKDLTHFSQSKYAKAFLQRHGISSRMLIDHLGVQFMNGLNRPGERFNKIIYNPVKGVDITEQLINSFPHLEFVSIENLTPSDVSQLLSSSKLYIDFGHHPGKDRFPREAVMCGCCVITGNFGASGFYEDTPVPESFQLDPYSKKFLENFLTRAENVFDSFDSNAKQFEYWRECVKGEKRIFQSQVFEYFNNLRHETSNGER